MKKNYFRWMALLVVVFFSLGLTACSGNDDDDEIGGGGDSSEIVSRLQGTWDFDHGSFNMMSMNITMDRNTMMMYKPANTEIWDLTLKFSGNRVNGTPYTIQNNHLLVEGMSIYDDISIVIKSLTNNVLVLAETVNMEDMSVTVDLEYHKK